MKEASKTFAVLKRRVLDKASTLRGTPRSFVEGDFSRSDVQYLTVDGQNPALPIIRNIP